jgi:transposase-like protein
MKKVTEQKQKHNATQAVLENEGSMAIEELLIENQQKFIQQTLDVEVEEFLGRKRYEHSKTSSGYRNGSYPKRVLLPGSTITVHKPHFRNVKGTFTSRILRGIAQLSDKLRMVALEMYIRGLSTRDIEATLREPNGKPMFSRSMISVLSERLYEQYKEFQARDLSQFDIVYLFVDGVYESVKRYTNNQTLLCAWAICSDGTKRFLHLAAVESESKHSWEVFFEGMTKRGLRQPLLVISDGAPGLIAAMEKYFPKADRQRCIAHKLRNIAAKLPRDVQKIILEEIKAVYYAADTQSAEVLASMMIEKYAQKYPSAMQCFNDDLPSCITHLKYPLGHRRYIRTTNLLERSFEEQKRRTKVFPQHQHERGCVGLVFAVLKRAADGWIKITMSDLELVQLKNIRALICPNEQSTNFISYQLAA